MCFKIFQFDFLYFLKLNIVILLRSWGLSPNQRCDVNQADVAPLMSSLAGVSIPVNNVGVLPVDYVSDDDITKARMLRSNAMQISAQYQKSLEQAKQKTIYFIPFGMFLFDIELSNYFLQNKRLFVKYINWCTNYC